MVLMGQASTAWAQLPGHPAGTLYQIIPVAPAPALPVPTDSGRTLAALPLDTTRPKPRKLKPDTVLWASSVSILPLSLAAQGLELAYEARLPRTDHTYRLSGGVFGGQRPWAYDADAMYAFRVEGQYRVHFLPKTYTRKGSYLGLYTMAKHIRLMVPGPGQELEPQPRRNSAISAGLLLGHQVRSPKGLVIDGFMGIGYMLPMWEDDDPQMHHLLFNPMVEGVSIRFGFGIGLLNLVRPARPM